MTKHPPQELYNVLLKAPEDIERDKELQMAYKRGYEAGCASHSSTTPAQKRIDALELLKTHFTWKRDIQRNQLFDAQGVLDAIDEAEKRALLQAGEPK